jgi:hypothetical protein
MEWSRIHFGSSEGDANSSINDGAEKGLEMGAEELHGIFLRGMPHLSEVHSEHDEVLAELVSRTAYKHDIVPLDQFLIDMGGTKGDSEISIPLPRGIKDNVAVETGIDAGTQIVRVFSSEGLDGTIGKFKLPEGLCVSSVRWEGEMLTMRLS